MNKTLLGMGLLLASYATGQAPKTAPVTGAVTLQQGLGDDYGLRTQARANIGNYVLTHLYNKEVGASWERGYGKVVSLRRKGFLEVGAAAFKLSDRVVYGADITKQYALDIPHVGKLKGQAFGIFPVNGDPFAITDNELSTRYGIKVRGFLNAPLAKGNMVRFVESELTKTLGCAGGTCYDLSLQNDYIPAKRNNITKIGLRIRR